MNNDTQIKTINTKFTKKEKEAVGILSIGTLLEYFDLMLYIHMAVILNKLFFPKTDAYVESLLQSFAFCSTYVLRPIGAVFFGYIGDNFGRKITIILTTIAMGVSCIVIANLSTYAEIGIKASIIMIACRALQGISSNGERVGATLYLTEFLPKKHVNFGVGLIVICTYAGGVFALIICTLITSFQFNWRVAFWIGAVISIVGIVARKALKETTVFINALTQKQLKDKSVNKGRSLLNEIKNIKFKTFISYCFIEGIYPFTFYFVFVFCTNNLKHTFKYTSNQIIFHNFCLSVVALLNVIIVTYLTKKVHPLKILKTRFIISIPIYIIIPFLHGYINNIVGFIMMQVIFLIVSNTIFPGHPMFYKHFPILNRFKYINLGFACSQTLMHVLTSLSIPVIVHYLSSLGMLVIIIPLLIGFGLSLKYFINLNKIIDEENNLEKLLIN